MIQLPGGFDEANIIQELKMVLKWNKQTVLYICFAVPRLCSSTYAVKLQYNFASLFRDFQNSRLIRL